MRTKTVYSFPTRSRCPSCGSLATKRTADSGRVQYRRCSEKKCGASFNVVGNPV